MILFGDLTIVSTPLGDLTYLKPEGAFTLVSAPESSLTINSVPEGILLPLPFFESSLSYPSFSSTQTFLPVPLATLMEILHIPVMAIDDGTGFLILDDGGRLIIK